MAIQSIFIDNDNVQTYKAAHELMRLRPDLTLRSSPNRFTVLPQ